MTSRIEIFRSSDNQVELKVSLDKETVWLSQQQMADLFSQTKQNISLHIGNIFKEKELNSISVVKESLTTASDGKNYKTKFYNLDVIISVGYRVKSQRGTQFRQWATQQLKDYLVQGYAINEDRLAQKQQEVQHLKTGIRILSRAVASKAEQEELDWLRYFAEGLQLLDDYDHEQLDGNKRIAAACFLLFLEKNSLLLNEDGQPIISNDGLASLTLLVAASQSEEMESIKQLIISVLNRSQRTER